MQMMPKHVFWPLSTVVACMPPSYTLTLDQSISLRRIGVDGHFRGHTIRCAISENLLLSANFTFIQPKLLPIDVLHLTITFLL